LSFTLKKTQLACLWKGESSNLEFKKLFAGPAPVSRNLIVDSAIGLRLAGEKKESAGATNRVIDLYELQGTF